MMLAGDVCLGAALNPPPPGNRTCYRRLLPALAPSGTDGVHFVCVRPASPLLGSSACKPPRQKQPHDHHMTWPPQPPAAPVPPPPGPHTPAPQDLYDHLKPLGLTGVHRIVLVYNNRIYWPGGVKGGGPGEGASGYVSSSTRWPLHLPLPLLQRGCRTWQRATGTCRMPHEERLQVLQAQPAVLPHHHHQARHERAWWQSCRRCRAQPFRLAARHMCMQCAHSKGQHRQCLDRLAWQ